MNVPRRAAWGAVLLVPVMTGCVSVPRFTFSRPAPAIVALPAPAGTVEEGVASYYAEEFNGRTTSNGEVYDMEQMTAAHRTMPFNTMVRVTNRNNGQSVVVRINDRGPFKDDRIIDLSLAAARKIGMIGPGTAEVRLEVIAAGDSTGTVQGDQR